MVRVPSGSLVRCAAGVTVVTGIAAEGMGWQGPLPYMASPEAGTAPRGGQWERGGCGVAEAFSVGGGLGWQVQLKLEGLEPTQFGPCHSHCPVPCGHWCGWVWGKGCRALLASALSACSVTHLQMHRSEELSGVSMCWAEAPLLSCGCFTSCRLKE